MIYSIFFCPQIVMFRVFSLLVEIILVFVLSAALLHKYGDWKRQNAMIIFVVLISWYFSLLTVFVLPLDISSVKTTSNRLLVCTAYYLALYSVCRPYIANVCKAMLLSCKMEHLETLHSAKSHGATFQIVFFDDFGESCIGPRNFLRGKIRPELFGCSNEILLLSNFSVMEFKASWKIYENYSLFGSLLKWLYKLLVTHCTNFTKIHPVLLKFQPH